jgi:hypothetical protein
VVWVHDMEPNVPVQNFRHQCIERTPACGNRVQDFRAISLSFDGVLNGFNLPTYAADTIEHFLFVSKYVSQEPPPQFSG